MSKQAQQREMVRGKCTAPKAVKHRAPHRWIAETPYWSRPRKREDWISTHESKRGTAGVRHDTGGVDGYGSRRAVEIDPTVNGTSKRRKHEGNC